MATRGPGRAIAAAIFSWLFPGLGGGLVARYRPMFAWIAVAWGVTLLTVISIWLLPLAFAVRFAAAHGSFRTVRAADRDGARTDWLGVAAAIGVNIAVSYAIRATALEAFKVPSSNMTPTLEIGDHIFTDKLSPRWRGYERGDVIVFRQPCTPERDYIKRVIALGGDTVEVRCSIVYVNGKPLAAELVAADCKYQDQDEMTLRWSERRCSEYREAADGRRYRVYNDEGRPARDAQGAQRTQSDQRDFPMLDLPSQPPACPTMGMMGASPREPSATLQQPGSIVETKAEAGSCELQRHYVVPANHVFVLGDNRFNSNDSRYWGSVPIPLIKGRVIGIWASIGGPGSLLGRFGGVD